MVIQCLMATFIPVQGWYSFIGLTSANSKSLSSLANPFLYNSPIILVGVRRKELPPASFPPCLQPQIIQQHVPVRQLVEDQVRVRLSVPVRRSVLCVPLPQRRLAEHVLGVFAAGDLGVQVVGQVGERPQALELQTSGVGDVAEHADEDEGAVALGGEPRGRDAAVEAPGGVPAHPGLVVVLRFAVRGAGGQVRGRQEARELGRDGTVGLAVEFGPGGPLLPGQGGGRQAELGVEATRRKGDARLAGEAGGGDEGVGGEGPPVAEVDGVGGEVGDVVPVDLDLPVADEVEEVGVEAQCSGLGAVPGYSRRKKK